MVAHAHLPELLQRLGGAGLRYHRTFACVLRGG
jgi:hypothetical protein